MPTNVSQEFSKAQARYFEAGTDEEKLRALEGLLKHMPHHKGAENLRANIRQRYKKLKEKIERKEKQKKTSRKESVKKEGIQVVFCGLTNSGKSSLLSCLTNAEPLIASYDFTTRQPVIGTLNYQGISFQIIDMPAINYESFDQGLANTSDILLIIITDLQDLQEILLFLKKAGGKKIIVFNKSDFLDDKQKRKIGARLQSEKHNFCIISCKTKEGIENLKELLVQESGVIRIYTKEPHKQADKEPVIMKPLVNVQDLAEKIFHKKIKIKEVRITGPSSKFSNQKVGLKHELKDKDVVEFHVE
jgi:hypothetical protein